MTTFEKLLENYWFVKDMNQESYNLVKQDLTDEIQDFIKNKLGYKLIVNPYLIKMEKIPGKPQEFMGIQEFDTKLEYVFLCLILIYLEERTRGEQFILSGLIDYIQNLVAEVDINDIKIDFTIYSQRKSMVKVLKFIKEMGFIKLYDGDENKFAENIENDVLYEVTGISKYFMRNFSSNITDCNLYTDIYEKEQLGLEQDKGKERRQRVYRRLFTENVVYKENENDQDYNYIRNYIKKCHPQYKDNDFYEMVEIYLCKILLEKFYLYRKGEINLFSKRQLKDNYKKYLKILINFEKRCDLYE